MNFTPKTAAAGIGGTLSVILLWVVGLILAKWNIVIPAEVAGAFSTLCSAAFSYVAPRSDPTPEQVNQILTTQLPKP